MAPNSETTMQSALLARAREARTRAYAPYSRFCVGAAVRTGDGRVFVGANYESASYGLTVCAERAALLAAQAAGAVPELVAIALVAGPAEGLAGAPPETPARPCGACRQWLYEASIRAGRDLVVWCGLPGGGEVVETSARQLLPDGFSL